MKISTETLEILKNFSDINPSIIFHPGNVVSTISQSRFIVARAEVNENFPVEAAFYNNLDLLLKSIKLLGDADVDFQSDRVIISSGKLKQNIRYSVPDGILSPKADPATKTFDWQFSVDLPASDFALLNKAATISGSPNLVIEADGEGSPIRVSAKDISDSSSNQSILELETLAPTKFQIIFSIENLKIIPSDYRLSVRVASDVKISHWKMINNPLDVEYFLALELSSSFEV